MDCVGEQTTIDNRLGRAGGLGALRDSRLCQPDFPVLDLPILTRSAALLTLLLRDGTVDLELTSSVVALDPGLAFGTLRVANLERNGEGEIWQLPPAVVAAGCDRLLAMVTSALKVESSYDCGTGARLRQLYARCVQRACIAEMLTNILGNANPKQSYLAGLLFGVLGTPNPEKAALPLALRSVLSDSLPDGRLAAVTGSSSAVGERNPIAASVFIANALLDLPEGENSKSSQQIQRLAASRLWEAWEERTGPERQQLLRQAWKLAGWAAANAPRLSPWEFMARLHRHKSWE